MVRRRDRGGEAGPQLDRWFEVQTAPEVFCWGQQGPATRCTAGGGAPLLTVLACCGFAKFLGRSGHWLAHQANPRARDMGNPAEPAVWLEDTFTYTSLRRADR